MIVLCAGCGAETALTEDEKRRVDPLFVPYWVFYCAACKEAQAARPIIGTLEELKDYVESCGRCTMDDRGLVRDQPHYERELAEALAMIDRLGATDSRGTSKDYLAQLGDA